VNYLSAQSQKLDEELNTYSDHLRLPEQTRQSLFEGVAEVIEQHGGFIERPYLAVLYVARKLD
jgi:hypothetical protein